MKAKWSSPSNLALVKYWGKYGKQLPRNSSLSITLDKCVTITEVFCQEQEHFDLEFKYDGILNPKFGEKTKLFLQEISDEIPFIKSHKLCINTINTFPHSTGIASSASSMSALAMCIVDIAQQTGQKFSNNLQTCSHLARLGSGSASRSVYPKFALWGKHESISKSAQEYAIPWEKEVHPTFDSLQDWVIIVQDTEKSVSSRAGHALMVSHPYANERYIQAQKNIIKLCSILKTGDWIELCDLVEEEALSLHGLMMSSRPGYILMHQDTITWIHAITKFRRDHHIPICFSLDAGPNMHVLFDKQYTPNVEKFIEETIREFDLRKSPIIKDMIGMGPKKIEY